MKKRVTLMLLVLVALAAPASAQQLFDFLGQANVPNAVGGTLEMYSIMANPAPATTPIPLDFGTYEYTVVVTGLTLDVDGSTQTYSGGTVTIYEDNGTAADYTDVSSFTDGAAILVGDLMVMTRTIFVPGLGSAAGTMDWTGGTRVDDIAPVDQLGWAFLSGISGSNVEPGFSERWDGKIEPQTPIVDVENVLWGNLKAMY